MFQPGHTIDRYVVESPLGSGAMATVYRVRHRDLGSLHALKMLRASASSLGDRMLQEGRIQAKLRHPNFVAVTDVVRQGGRIGLVMDYVDGLALGDLLHHTRLDPPQLDELAAGLFDAMEAAHSLGLVHRDLKLDNIMMAFTPDRLVPRIMDFGLAKAVRDELRVARSTRTGSMMGTPAFMAPEQYRDASAVDHRADLYSLGAVLYEAIADEPVFPDDDLPVLLAKCQMGDWRPLDEVAPHAPARWREAIHACLAVEPDDRPQSVAALRERWKPAAHRGPTWAPSQLDALRAVQVVAESEASLVTSPFPAPERNLSIPITPLSTLEEPPVPTPSLLARWVVPAAILLTLLTAVLGGGIMAGRLVLPTSPPDPPRPEALEPLAPPQAAPASDRLLAAVSPTPPPEPSPRVPVAPPALPSHVELGGLDGYLLSPEGERYPLQGAPAGTYDLYVFFDARVPSLSTTVTLAPGQPLSLRCDRRSRRCR